MYAISISRHGGPEVLEYRAVAAPQPTEDEVLVAVDIAGVNFIDTYFREGIYPHDTPFTPGFEGTGRVIHDPQGKIAEGTLVAWCDAFGSYAEQVTVPRDRLVAVPRGIAPEVAASMLLQGITAHYLTHGVYALQSGDSCLITAGAGGVGLLATQMAKKLGAFVITVVSTAEKEALSREAGADVVLRYGDDLVQQVKEATDGRGVDVVYDGVGKATFEQSLDVVRPRGTVCLFGAASGPVDPVDPQTLNAHGSIFLTRPSIGAWTAEPGEFVMRAQAVTQAIVEGDLNIRVGARYPITEAAQAHRDLEARKTTGSIILDITAPKQ